MKKHIANIITGSRILGSILMLLFPAFSVQFYFLYLFCGFSDMVDGTVARKTNNADKFGARFDTASDFVFVAMSLIKFLPLIHIQKWLWIWIIIIAIIKALNVILGYISEKHFIPPHTIMNKITGLLLFLFPLSLSFLELKYSSIAVCLTATFSAIQEGVCIAKNKQKCLYK